jgi:hypothetical protein
VVGRPQEDGQGHQHVQPQGVEEDEGPRHAVLQEEARGGERDLLGHAEPAVLALPLGRRPLREGVERLLVQRLVLALLRRVQAWKGAYISKSFLK